jgi:metallo-beta-lactamase class B
MTVREDGKEYHVVFLGSTSRVGAKLVGDALYPQIAEDYANTFKTLRALPCDVFLASHASFYGGQEKSQQLVEGAQANPFIDPAGYRAFLDRQEDGFREEFKKNGRGKAAIELSREKTEFRWRVDAG